MCVGQMGASAVDSSQLHPSSNTVHQRETVSVTFSRAVTSLRKELEAGCRLHSLAAPRLRYQPFARSRPDRRVLSMWSVKE